MNLATLFLLADTPAPKPETGLQGMNMMIWMAFAFALIYFMSIRPQAKKQKELQARITQLKTGDRVVTSGGIYGTVANVKDGSTLILKIADNVKIEIDKTAIANVVNPETGKPESTTALAKA
jgi:preprotein translocase subunit YajC